MTSIVKHHRIHRLLVDFKSKYVGTRIVAHHVEIELGIE